MSDKIFIDTNIFVYAKLATTQETEKQQQAKQFLKSQQNTVVISTQVLSEFASVLIKHRIDDETIKNSIAEIIQDCIVSPVSLSTIQTAWEIKTRYHFSYWDSVIIASALENNCAILATEDLQDNQIIAEKMRVKNPFKLA
jgi:predicted nucleic acid-binding protein